MGTGAGSLRLEGPVWTSSRGRIANGRAGQAGSVGDARGPAQVNTIPACSWITTASWDQRARSNLRAVTRPAKGAVRKFDQTVAERHLSDGTPRRSGLSDDTKVVADGTATPVIVFDGAPEISAAWVVRKEAGRSQVLRCKGADKFPRHRLAASRSARHHRFTRRPIRRRSGQHRIRCQANGDVREDSAGPLRAQIQAPGAAAPCGNEARSAGFSHDARKLHYSAAGGLHVTTDPAQQLEVVTSSARPRRRGSTRRAAQPHVDPSEYFLGEARPEATPCHGAEVESGFFAQNSTLRRA